MLQATTLLLFPLVMAFAALSDLFTMTISNRISIALVAVFVPFAWLVGLSGAEIGIHLLCGFGVLVLTFGMFAFGWIGGGDAKLAAATAVWVGWQHLGEYGLYSTFLGGMLTLAHPGRCAALPMPLFAMRLALGGPPARRAFGHSLWDRPGDRRPGDLPGHRGVERPPRSRKQPSLITTVVFDRFH